MEGAGGRLGNRRPPENDLLSPRLRVRRARWIPFGLFHGDMEDVRGAYTLEPDGHGNTEVTLSLRVRPGVPVPGALERVLTRVLLPGALDDLERQVEDG